MSKMYQVLFFTHTAAIKFKRKLQKINIKCELMPVPRSLSSSCGVSAKIEYKDSLAAIIDDQIEKIYQIQNDQFILVYTIE